MFKPLEADPGSTVTVTVDGVAVAAGPTETVASVLLRLPPHHARRSPISGRPHAPYCMMGVCFECLAIVNGVPSVQTCLETVREGMVIHRQTDGVGEEDR